MVSVSSVMNSVVRPVAGAAALFASLASAAGPLPHPLLAPGNLNAYTAQVMSISPRLNAGLAVEALANTLRQGPASVERAIVFSPYGEGRPKAYFVVSDNTHGGFYANGIPFCFEGAAGRIDSLFVLMPTGDVFPLDPAGQNDCAKQMSTPWATLVSRMSPFTMI